MARPRTPVVFIHGLWLHATSWDRWLELYRRAGYDPVAPGWLGEPRTVAAAREHPERVADTSIDDEVAHYTEIVESLNAKPIIVGHSFGGLLAEQLLGMDLAVAAVAIDAEQSKGVLPLALAQLMAALPALGNPANLRKAVSLTARQFRFGFGNELTELESNELFEAWAIPSPARPLFQATVTNFAVQSEANVNPGNETRGPLLLISGKQDHTVPDASTRSGLPQHRDSTAVTELTQFAGRGHSLTIDHGWHEVAHATLEWLKVNVGRGESAGAAATAPSR